MVQLARLPNSQFENGKSNVLHVVQCVVQFCKIPKSMKTVVFLSLSQSFSFKEIIFDKHVH